MKLRFVTAALPALLLIGCVSHDGTYAPGCIAFEGSEINLGDGRFVWKKFTDSIVVDDAGNVVNQFPGYPMQGTYSIDGQILHLESASGETLADMYLQRQDGRYYLLTAEQFDAWEKTGKHTGCALVLGGYSV